MAMCRCPIRGPMPGAKPRSPIQAIRLQCPGINDISPTYPLYECYGSSDQPKSGSSPLDRALALGLFPTVLQCPQIILESVGISDVQKHILQTSIRNNNECRAISVWRGSEHIEDQESLLDISHFARRQLAFSAILIGSSIITGRPVAFTKKQCLSPGLY
jgi:hypothetical protein